MVCLIGTGLDWFALAVAWLILGMALGELGRLVWKALDWRSLFF